MGGTAGAVDRRAASVGRMLLDRVAATPDREAFRYPVAGPDGETWQSLSWAEVGERAQAVAAGLLALGLRPEDRVAIMAGTRLEWVLADLGIMCAGGATTTVYPSTQPDDVAYILSDAGCRVAFAEDHAQLAKLRSIRDQLPDLHTVVTFDAAPAGGSGGPGDGGPADREPGDREPGDREPGDREPGDREPGDREPGDREPGDHEPGDRGPGDHRPGDHRPGYRGPGDRGPGDRGPGDRGPGDPAGDGVLGLA